MHAMNSAKSRRVAFLMFTILSPVVLLGIVELALRLTVRAEAYPLFVSAPFAPDTYLLANRHVANRWFASLPDPPAPRADPFAAEKPRSTFRVFILGESSAAGFPYRGAVTFAPLLREALRVAMPNDSVEVVNLAMAAINSYGIWDMATELPSFRPDAVLVYAGHNEYYGALGVASRQGSVLASPRLVRTYLRLLRLRLVWVLRAAVARIGSGLGSEVDMQAPGLMEVLARDQAILYDSPEYRAGVRQLASNLEATVERLRRAGIPVFIGSVASNLLDQAPFAAPENDAPGGAVELYDEGRRLRAAGDTLGALKMLERARDSDVVRFRAPTEFNEVIRAVSTRPGVFYVPVAETFLAASEAGLPGEGLFLEHVHPNQHGHALIARAFFEAVAGSRVAGDRISRFEPDWAALAAAAPHTSFDERVVVHTIRTITSRWPFVRAEDATDYRAGYVPVDFADSLAFGVSRGSSWQQAKLQLGSSYERRGWHDSAAAEYRSLVADLPYFPEPRLLLARVLAAAGLDSLAREEEIRAAILAKSPELLVELARTAVANRQAASAAQLLTRAAAMSPNNPSIVYQLSLAHAMAGSVDEARKQAVLLSRIAPDYPGLDDWLRELGVRR
jgi:tetratricopeptide (TPR) repeat protein